MEEILNVIMTYLPIPTAVITVIVSGLSMVKKIKDLVSDEKKKNEVLNKALAKAYELANEAVVKGQEEVIKISEEVKAIAEQTKAVIEEKELINNAIKDANKTFDELNTIKAQLTALLNKEEK